MRTALREEVLRELRALTSDVDHFDQAVADFFQVPRTDFRCLDHLSRIGPVSAGQLADAVGLTTGATTAAIDRLERIGWVQRQSDPADRRRVRVALTQEGIRCGEQVFGALRLAAERLLDQYGPQDLAGILAFLRDTRTLFAERALAVRTSPADTVRLPLRGEH